MVPGHFAFILLGGVDSLVFIFQIVAYGLV